MSRRHTRIGHKLGLRFDGADKWLSARRIGVPVLLLLGASESHFLGYTRNGGFKFKADRNFHSLL